jgi:hypothetical protein
MELSSEIFDWSSKPPCVVQSSALRSSVSGVIFLPVEDPVLILQVDGRLELEELDAAKLFVELLESWCCIGGGLRNEGGSVDTCWSGFFVRLADYCIVAFAEFAEFAQTSLALMV